VTDIPSNINKIEEVIKRLDMRTMQVLIEAKILSMSDSKQKDLGIKWTSLQEYTIGIQSPVRQYQYVRRGGKGVWDDSTENVDTDGSTDTKTTTNNTDVDRDVIYSPTSGTYSDTSTYNMVSNLDSSLTKIFTSTMLKSDIRTAILSASDFQLVLSALQSQTDVSLISNPRILTANNEKAEIKIVSEYPIPNYTFDTTTSTFTIAGFDFKPIGVIFAVVPNISFDGYVTMQIDPEVSTLLDEKSFSAGGATVQIPYIGRKKASAKLVIKSGETLAIGGLIDEQNKTVVTKVPLLGDIPVLGRLFRHDSVGKDKANIIFFITATVIDDTTKGVLLSGNESSVFQAPADVVEQIVNVPKAEPIDAGKNTPAVNKGTVAVAQKPKEAGKTSGISVLKRDSSDKD
jgi:type IV pilus assembly protein PilQ